MLLDADVTASADALCGDLGKKAFDQVEPRRAGWREVQLEARVLRQPGLDLGRLVGGVVVEHEMHVARLEDSAVDAAQKTHKLLGCGLYGDQQRRDGDNTYRFQVC